jgi:hypothetical protein
VSSGEFVNTHSNTRVWGSWCGKKDEKAVKQVNVYVCMYVCAYVYIYIYAHIHELTRKSYEASDRVCMYVCVCVCVCLSAYSRTYPYTQRVGVMVWEGGQEHSGVVCNPNGVLR